MKQEQSTTTDLPPIEKQIESFERLKPKLEQISEDALEAINLDFGRMSVAGRSLLNKTRQPHVKARLDAVPPEMFDPGLLQDLEDLSTSLWYLKVQGVTTDAQRTTRAIPEHLKTEASEIRGRLFPMVNYYLRTTPENIATIDKIKEGSGHVDLAIDLEMLAKLVVNNRGQVEQDTVHYRAEDPLRATELAQEIRAALAQEASLDWAKWSARAFTMMVKVYEAVLKATEFACTGLPNAPKLVGLFIAARKPPRRKTDKGSKKEEGQKKTDKKKKKKKEPEKEAAKPTKKKTDKKSEAAKPTKKKTDKKSEAAGKSQKSPKGEEGKLSDKPPSKAAS